MRLIKILRSDTNSQTAVALEGWAFPISRETAAILDLYDRFVEANSDSKKGRPKPHPARPWPTENRAQQRIGDAGNRTPDEVKAILHRMARGEAPV